MKEIPKSKFKSIGAVVLAAGLSTRMGTPKLLLPWGQTTIIEQTIHNLLMAGVADIVIVTGGYRKEIETLMASQPVRFVFNPQFDNGEMLISFQAGLQNLRPETCATLMVLGDQPHIPPDVIQQVAREFTLTGHGIIFPSYNQRRGHPWLVERSYWSEIIHLKPPQTLRDFMHDHTDAIQYIVTNHLEILQDLDTPEDYQRLRPRT